MAITIKFNIINNYKKMTNKFFKILTLGALTLSLPLTFASCSDDDNDDDKQEPEVTIDPVKYGYILNEGTWNGNNSKLDIYHADGTIEKDVFAKVNGEAIGDTGQDLLAYGGRLYLAVWGSNYIAKLDKDCKLIEKYSFKAEEGQPRHLAAQDGFVYVSTYGSKVAKFDTTSLAAPKGFVEVGDNPEAIAVKGNYLVVCNSQKDNVSDTRISVIDLTSFSLKENITTEYGNFQSVEVVGDSVYVTYYTPTYAIEMLNLDLSKNTVKPSGAATKMVAYDGKLYCANVATVYDADWNATTNTSFFVRDVKTGKDSNFLDLSQTPELTTATVYMLSVDPSTGEFFVGVTDYKTNGTIYRFDKDGKFVTKFETSGVNPNKMENVNW
jgi:hypothetical protein